MSCFNNYRGGRHRFWSGVGGRNIAGRLTPPPKKKNTHLRWRVLFRMDGLAVVGPTLVLACMRVILSVGVWVAGWVSAPPAPRSLSTSSLCMSLGDGMKCLNCHKHNGELKLEPCHHIFCSECLHEYIDMQKEVDPLPMFPHLNSSYQVCTGLMQTAVLLPA